MVEQQVAMYVSTGTQQDIGVASCVRFRKLAVCKEQAGVTYFELQLLPVTVGLPQRSTYAASDR